MCTDNYQLDYAAGRPQMYDLLSREKRALRIIKTLADYYGSQKELKKCLAIDIGSSTGIIDFNLAKYFKKLTGTDIDKKAIEYSKRNFKLPNLQFKVEDAIYYDYEKHKKAD